MIKVIRQVFHLSKMGILSIKFLAFFTDIPFLIQLLKHSVPNSDYCIEVSSFPITIGNILRFGSVLLSVVLAAAACWQYPVIVR